MENVGTRKKRKKFYQADFLTRPVLLYAALLFTVFQVVKLIRLFSDAVAYKKVNEVVPVDFTLGAVAGALLLIGLVAWVLVILLRQKRGLSVIRRGNRFLLLDLLLAVYGLVRAIQQALLFFQNFEILFLLDVLAILGGLIATPLILFLADRQRIPPGDILLLIIGAGVIGLSILSFIMVAISIGKDYTVLHAIPELLFRLGVLLAGLSTLFTALKLRAELPIDAPLIKPVKEKVKKKPRELHFKLFDNLPGYEDEEGDMQLFDDGTPEEDEDFDEDAYTDDVDDEEAYEPQEENEPPAVKKRQAPPVDERGRMACPHCGRRFPAYLGVCPYCGRDPEEE